MDAQLLERAKKVAALATGSKLTPNDFTEIGQVYFLLTGKTVPCTSCVVYRLLNEISQKVIQQPLKLDPMATTHKFHFLPGKEATRPIRHMETGTRIITSDNLNKGDNGAWMAENYPHLIQEVKETETKTATKAEPAKTETKSEAKEAPKTNK